MAIATADYKSFERQRTKAVEVLPRIPGLLLEKAVKWYKPRKDRRLGGSNADLSDGDQARRGRQSSKRELYLVSSWKTISQVLC